MNTHSFDHVKLRSRVILLYIRKVILKWKLKKVSQYFPLKILID